MRKGPDGKMVKVFGEYDIRDESTKVTQYGSTIRMQEDLAGLRKQFLTEVEPYDKILRSSGEALTLAKGADIGNPTATEAFRSAIARAFRSDGQVAQAEVQRLINAGAITDRVANGFLRFFNGTITQETIDNAKQTLRAMRSYAAKQRRKAEEQNRKNLSSRLNNNDVNYVVSGAEMDAEDAQDFPAPNEPPKPVVNNDVKNRAAEILKNRNSQQGK